jgi:hypothetical protein
VPGEMPEITVLLGSKMKCFITQLIHLLPNAYIRAVFFFEHKVAKGSVLFRS